MITNFEDITPDLTEKEKELVPAMIKGFSSHDKSDPIKAPEIIKRLKSKGYGFSEVKLRKYVNYIRANSLLPLMSTSKGYYVSDDQEEILSQIKSLNERASAIKKASDGLLMFIKGNGVTP